MSKTVERIRREAGLKWSEIWLQLGQEPPPRFRSSRRRKLPRGLSMAAIRRVAKRQNGQMDWLSEITLCQAMNNVANLQTDIKDFVPTTQSGNNKQEAA